MPCAAPVRGKTDIYYPWDPDINNDPCGMKLLTSVSGVDVSAENLCRFHWLQKHGQRDLVSDYGKAVLADAPIVWVRLDETAGLIAKDAMGGPDWGVSAGMIKGQPPMSGQGGFSMESPNTTDSVGTPTSGPTTITGAITLEAWVRVTRAPAVGATYYILQKGASYQMRLDDFGSGPQASIFMWDAVATVRGASASGATAPRQGQVYHYVGTWDLTTIRFYVNGVEVQNAPWLTGPIVTTGNSLTVGPGPIAVDDAALYNKALSPARILAHYQAGAGILVTEP